MTCIHSLLLGNGGMAVTDGTPFFKDKIDDENNVGMQQ